jgi:hypothetical protein
MGRIFDDPHQQARVEWAESTCPYCGYSGCDGRCEDSGQEDDGPARWDGDEFSKEATDGEETLTDAECFHYLLYSDIPDGDWEEIHRKVLRGARPKPSK